MAKHLLDETAEFRMPRIGRHAAEDDPALEETLRWQSGPSRQPAVPEKRDFESR